MTIEQAIHNVKVCKVKFFRGTEEEHQIMNQSIKLIEERLAPKTEEPEVKENVGSDA